MKTRPVDESVRALRNALVADRAVRLWRAMEHLWFDSEDSPFAAFIEATAPTQLNNGDEVVQRMARKIKPKRRRSAASLRKQARSMKRVWAAKRKAAKK